VVKEAVRMESKAVMRAVAVALAALVMRGAYASPDAPEVKQSAQVDTMTIGGDFRYRVEYFDYRDNPADLDKDKVKRGGKERERQRIRLRLKSEYKLRDSFSVVGALATGTGESVSTNQTMANLGTQKGIWIDQAYAAWRPGFLGEAGSLGLFAGRMANPLWRPYSADIVFDSDFSPEGTAASASYLVLDAVNVFVNSMQMSVHEMSTNARGVWEFSNQVGVEVPLPLALRLTVAGAMHNWLRTSDTVLGQNPVQLGNTRPSSTLLNPYRVGEVSAQLGGWIPVPIPGKEMSLPVSIQGTFIKNLDALGPDSSSIWVAGKQYYRGTSFIGKSDQGYQVGAILGKASAPNSFEVAYFYKRAQWDCTMADVADSDFGEGGLGRKGNIAWAAYTPNGFVTFQVKVFSVRLLDKRYTRNTDKTSKYFGKLTQNDRINRIQADVSVKF
jgi:hypothetical protein